MAPKVFILGLYLGLIYVLDEIEIRVYDYEPSLKSSIVLDISLAKGNIIRLILSSFYDNIIIIAWVLKICYHRALEVKKISTW